MHIISTNWYFIGECIFKKSIADFTKRHTIGIVQSKDDMFLSWHFNIHIPSPILFELKSHNIAIIFKFDERITAFPFCEI